MEKGKVRKLWNAGQVFESNEAVIQPHFYGSMIDSVITNVSN
jgi:hypothetical protein